MTKHRRKHHTATQAGQREDNHVHDHAFPIQDNAQDNSRQEPSATPATATGNTASGSEHHVTQTEARVNPSPAVLPFTRSPVAGADMLGAFFTWPLQLFDMLLKPWSNLSYMTPWFDDYMSSFQGDIPGTKTSETEKEYVYQVQLPNVRSEQVALSFQNNNILLRVEEFDKQEEGGYTSQESRTLRRAFSLPVYTNAEEIIARLIDGTLTIVIPKSDKPVGPKSRTIEIN